MYATISKVESLDKSVAQLDSKIDAKLSGLDTKLDAILHSLFEVKKPRPSDAERVQQLDQFISLRNKHTIEEAEQKYNSSLDHYLHTITTMLRVLDDKICATN